MPLVDSKGWKVLAGIGIHHANGIPRIVLNDMKLCTFPAWVCRNNAIVGGGLLIFGKFPALHLCGSYQISKPRPRVDLKLFTGFFLNGVAYQHPRTVPGF